VLTATGIDAGHRAGEPVLTGVDLSIVTGEVVGLAGPSGSGKSTLARVLALLLAPWAGAVTVDGTTATGVRYRVQPELRTAVGMVFQSPRLSVDQEAVLRPGT
jgi:peptide/nickel transport system ATP-binding protein